jgi:hypothetical protein
LDLSLAELERFEVGDFGDTRLQKRGPGVISVSRCRRDRAFAHWRAENGAVRLDLGGFFATRL